MRTAPTRTRTTALPLALLLVFAPAHAQAEERWVASLGLGAVDAYTWRTYSFSFSNQEYHEQFDFTWHGSLGLGYTLSSHFSLLVDAGYLGYEEQSALMGIPEAPPITSTLSATFPSMGAGIRYYPAGPSTSRPRAYVQVSPTIYFSRWKTQTSQAGSVAEETFRELQPGFVAGVGVVGLNQAPVHVDLGVRYFYSPNFATQDLGGNSGDFKGLRQLAMIVGVQRRL